MRVAMIAVPVLLSIHNIEEIFGGMGATRDVLRARLPPAIGLLVGSAEAWLFAVVVFTVVPWLLLLLGGLDRPDSPVARLLVVLQMGMTLNVLSHIGGAFAVRGYAGGVVTAVVLYVPFSLWFFRRAWRDEWVSRTLLRRSPVLALLLLPILFALLALGSALTA